MPFTCNHTCFPLTWETMSIWMWDRNLSSALCWGLSLNSFLQIKHKQLIQDSTVYYVLVTPVLLTCICFTSPDTRLILVSLWYQLDLWVSFINFHLLPSMTSSKQFYLKEWCHFNHTCFLTCICLMSPWCCAWWCPGPSHLSYDGRNLYQPTSEWLALKVDRLKYLQTMS